MYSEKVKEIINLTKDSSKKVFVINTMAVMYERPSENIHVLSINNKNLDALYGILDTIKDSLIVFDNLFWWVEDRHNAYEGLSEIVNYLGENSKSNNNVIIT
jgi:hypothetical protein